MHWRPIYFGAVLSHFLLAMVHVQQMLYVCLQVGYPKVPWFIMILKFLGFNRQSSIFRHGEISRHIISIRSLQFGQGFRGTSREFLPQTFPSNLMSLTLRTWEIIGESRWSTRGYKNESWFLKVNFYRLYLMLGPSPLDVWLWASRHSHHLYIWLGIHDAEYSRDFRQAKWTKKNDFTGWSIVFPCLSFPFFIRSNALCRAQLSVFSKGVKAGDASGSDTLLPALAEINQGAEAANAYHHVLFPVKTGVNHICPAKKGHFKWIMSTITARSRHSGSARARWCHHCFRLPSMDFMAPRFEPVVRWGYVDIFERFFAAKSGDLKNVPLGMFFFLDGLLSGPPHYYHFLFKGVQCIEDWL